MTSETRTLIEISDISAIELECATCHTAIVLRLEETAGPSRTIPNHCPNCRAHLMAYGEADYEALKTLVEHLRYFPTREGKVARVRLVVTGVHGEQ